MTVRIISGDCREVLRTLEEKSVHACVCSPPYFRLRDYQTDGQIGLEPTPDAYIAELVEVFREVRRVLKDDGSLWINIGDGYAGSGRGGNATRASSTLQGSTATQEASMICRQNWEVGASARAAAVTQRGRGLPAGLHEKARQSGAVGRAWEPPPAGLKPKDLIGIPWMLAFALRADGWWLRNDNVWAKPNGMPESTRDRSTRAHEYVFHFSKSEIYYHGYEDTRLPAAPESVGRLARAMRDRLDIDASSLVVSGPDGYAPTGQPAHTGARRRDKQRGHSRRDAGFNDRWDKMEKTQQQSGGAALRTVWWISPGGYKDEFCQKCRSYYPSHKVGALRTERIERDGRKITLRFCDCGSSDDWLTHFAVMPAELAATCILAGAPADGVILDPFAGAGTTGLVADRLQRNAILIELNPDYAEMAARRIGSATPMLTDVRVEKNP